MNIAMPVQSRPRSERSPSLSKKGLGGRFIPILEQHYELRKGGLRPNDLSDVLARHNQNVKHKRDSAPDILTEMREKEMKEKREAALRHKAKEMEDLRRRSIRRPMGRYQASAAAGMMGPSFRGCPTHAESSKNRQQGETPASAGSTQPGRKPNTPDELVPRQKGDSHRNQGRPRMFSSVTAKASRPSGIKRTRDVIEIPSDSEPEAPPLQGATKKARVVVPGTASCGTQGTAELTLQPGTLDDIRTSSSLDDVLGSDAGVATHVFVWSVAQGVEDNVSRLAKRFQRAYEEVVCTVKQTEERLSAQLKQQEMDAASRISELTARFEEERRRRKMVSSLTREMGYGIRKVLNRVLSEPDVAPNAGSS